MRERRRVRLAERQIMLARIARREAMGTLAGTIHEETRSQQLAQRSRALSSTYSARGDITLGAELRDLAAMSGELVRLAGDADRAGEEARRRARQQADVLANTENRLKRLEEHATKARRTLSQVEDARERSHEAGSHAKQMAQKLLQPSKPAQTNSGTKP